MVCRSIAEITPFWEADRKQQERERKWQGFSREEGYALDAAVRGVVERAISSLEAIGLSHEGALNLLMIQAAIRMEESGVTETKRLLRSLENDLEPPEG